MDLLKQLAENTKPSNAYAEESFSPRTDTSPLVRLIAYYLPQFHPIPENDAWWGKGFTEWRNVTKALPRFKGHYQPRMPGELGFYDLRLPDILRRQAELAHRYGIEGFCFHYYWFAGKRLLESPLNLLLNTPDIKLPFCINWANENWSRRWDGQDQDVLMAQQHSPEDDIAFARSLEPYFRDPRYIRINGRPLMMLYRPGVLPDAAATVKRWREHFVKSGFGNPYIVMAQAFGDEDPLAYGMDAEVGFPPHKSGWGGGARNNQSLEMFDPDYQGQVNDYEKMATDALSNCPTEFMLFPGVCPAWDNEARKPNKGFCFHGSSPEKYGKWLEGACENVMQREKDERIVFINAWNEWAEGAYLEPDLHYGYAYLAETAAILNNLGTSKNSVKRQAVNNNKNLSLQGKQRSLAFKAVRKVANKTADVAEIFAKVIRFK